MNRELWGAFEADLDRYFVFVPEASTAARVRLALATDGLWALAAYRAARAVRDLRGPLAALGRFAAGLFGWLVRIVTGIHLDPRAEIAPGFYIGHLGSIHVGAGVRIGPGCSIGQMCHLAASEAGGAPVLGARVYVGVGAKILGPVRIGDGAAIGANAVVLEDVPENAVVVGNPAAIASYKGSGDFIVLRERRATTPAPVEQRV